MELISKYVHAFKMISYHDRNNGVNYQLVASTSGSSCYAILYIINIVGKARKHRPKS